MDELRGDRIVLRPIRRDDTEPLRAIHQTPEVAKWWGRMSDDFPFDEPESTRFTVPIKDDAAALTKSGGEKGPASRHAWIDLFLDPRLQGQGLGTDAVATIGRHLIEARGHHRITIDPAT